MTPDPYLQFFLQFPIWCSQAGIKQAWSGFSLARAFRRNFWSKWILDGSNGFSSHEKCPRAKIGSVRFLIKKMSVLILSWIGYLSWILIMTRGSFDFSKKKMSSTIGVLARFIAISSKFLLLSKELDVSCKGKRKIPFRHHTVFIQGYWKYLERFGHFPVVCRQWWIRNNHNNRLPTILITSYGLKHHESTGFIQRVTLMN